MVTVPVGSPAVCRHLCSAVGPPVPSPGVGIFAAPACSSAEPAEHTPHATACSTGLPYDIASYPAPASPSSQHGALPECVPRCGAEQKFQGAPYGILYSIAALPSGECANDGERCAMSAAIVAACGGVVSPCDLVRVPMPLRGWGMALLRHVARSRPLPSLRWRVTGIVAMGLRDDAVSRNVTLLA